MAPLMGALTARAPDAAAAGAGGAPQATEGGAFAVALGEVAGVAGDPATATAPGSGAGTESAARPGAGIPESLEDMHALPSAEAAALAAAQGSPGAVNVQDAEAATSEADEAPWPPTGLAGLFGPAAGGDIHAPPVDDGQATATGLRARGAAPGPFPVASAGMPAASAAGAGVSGGASPESAGPPAMAMAAAEALASASGGDPSTADGIEPAPPAFGLPPLPAPAALREAAPLLAAPGPAPEVRSPDFSERFGAQLQWMAEQNIGHARIRISPQELGPVEVLLRLDGDRISADFISGHAETRQALEQGLPRLRDLLGEHGFQLAHAGVGGDAPASREHGGGPGGDAFGDTGDASIPPVSAHDAAAVRVSRGLLDAYA